MKLIMVAAPKIGDECSKARHADLFIFFSDNGGGHLFGPPRLGQELKTESFHLERMCASHGCIAWLHRMVASHGCIACLHRMFASHVCIACLHRMFASHVCIACLHRMKIFGKS
jgi:hypothetical protein